MFAISLEDKSVYIFEVFIYCIALTYFGFIVSRVIDNFMDKINDKIKDDDIVKKHLLTFLHIGLIGISCLFIREIIVLIEDFVIGKTWGNPAKYATVIMGSIMFSNSKTIHKNIKLIAKKYNI